MTGHPAALRRGGSANHPLAHAVTVVQPGMALFPGYLPYTVGVLVPRTRVPVRLLTVHTGMSGGPGNPY